jgi:hypothetical protein
MPQYLVAIHHPDGYGRGPGVGTQGRGRLPCAGRGAPVFLTRDPTTEASERNGRSALMRRPAAGIKGDAMRKLKIMEHI